MCRYGRDWEARREEALEAEPVEATDEAEPDEPEPLDEPAGPERLPPIQPSD